MSFDDRVASMDRNQLRTFGVAVSYAPLGGPAVTTTPSNEPLLGIFDEQYVLAKGSAEAGVETLGPAVFLRLEDLPEDPQDDTAEPTLTIRGINYRVIERKPDGMGVIVLALRRVT